MLRETDIFSPAGTLPDVSQSVVIGGGQSASALAGINSGADYAKAIYAAAYRPLTDTAKKKEDSLDTDPTAPTANRAALERRALGRKLQQRMSTGSRPDSSYTVPGAPVEPPVPGSEDTPVAGSGEPGNLLGLPNPEEPAPLFPATPKGVMERPTPLLPPALQPAPPWNPADIFRNIFP